MELSITKNTGKPHILSYKRDNGSVTWMHTDDFFVRHDLSHFAIEKTLGYRSAFMGMLNSGMDIKAFEDRNQRKQMTITDEAANAENMANLFLMEIAQGDFDDFNSVLKESFVDMGTRSPIPRLTEDELGSIRHYLRQLLREWHQLPAGEKMILNIVL
jgi:hypothetical protein